MKTRYVLYTLAVVLILFVATGCPPAQKPQEQQTPAPATPQAQQVEFDVTTLVGQWVDSGHANIQLYPAERDNCVVCHDGGAFALQLTTQEELQRDFHVAIDCRACHTGRGAELLEAGTVDIPTQENVQAGLGAQCLACHNERRAPNIEDENRSAPHPSSQAGVFTGTGGIRVESFNYGNSAHAGIDNTCVHCHMTETEAGFSSHTFAVDNPQAACGDCHQNVNDVNLSAGNDYDGDGETKGFQDEVAGLLTHLENAITEALGGGSFETGGGLIIFNDATGNEMEVPAEVYQAAYNYTLVTYDGSLGIHNPTLVVQLLQQSYQALTGEQVPNAQIR